MTGTTSIRLFAELTTRTEANKENEVDENFILNECLQLLERADIKRAPVDLKLLASFRDIRKIEDIQMAEAGKLIPLHEGGLHIQLRESDSPERRNFSLGHEITHTFFPDYKLKPQHRVDKEVGEYNRKDRTECLCDFGASHLLMPPNLFGPYFKKFGFSIEGLKKIARIFRASLEATGMKMVNEDPSRLAFAVWEEKFKPSEYGIARAGMLFEQYRPKKKLRIKFGFGLQGIGHIPAEKSLEEDGAIIQEAFNDTIPKRGVETIDFGSFSTRCEVEAVSFGYHRNKKVIALMKLV